MGVRFRTASSIILHHTISILICEMNMVIAGSPERFASCSSAATLNPTYQPLLQEDIQPRLAQEVIPGKNLLYVLGVAGGSLLFVF